MFRTDNPTAISGRFTDGDPSQGIPPSIWPSESANAWQEELAFLVESAGITLSKADEHQAAAAVRRLSQGSNLLIGATMFEEFQGYRGGTNRTPGAILGPFFEFHNSSTTPQADIYAYDGALEVSAAVTAGQTIVIRSRNSLSWALNPRTGIVSGNSYAFNDTKLTAQATGRAAAGSVPFTMEISNLTAATSTPAAGDILAETKPTFAPGEVKTAVQIWGPTAAKTPGFFEIKLTASGNGNLRAMIYGLGVRPGVVLAPLDLTPANRESDRLAARLRFQVIKTRVRLGSGQIPSGGTRATYVPTVRFLDRLIEVPVASDFVINIPAVYGRTPAGAWDYSAPVAGFDLAALDAQSITESTVDLRIQGPAGPAGDYLAEIEITIRK